VEENGSTIKKLEQYAEALAKSSIVPKTLAEKRASIVAKAVLSGPSTPIKSENGSTSVTPGNANKGVEHLIP
jgi:hypothetical protein